MIIKNCELWYAKLDPKRPNSRFSKKNPTWEVQIRTSDKEVVKIWEQSNLKCKPVIPDEGDPYWRVNLKKRSIKSDDTPADPVQVVDGNLDPVNPNSIGNGSIGNIRLFQYDYENEDQKGVASILMGIQLTKHILYKPKPGESFEETETEIIAPSEEEMEDDDDYGEDKPEEEKPKKSPSPSPSPSVGSKDDEEGDF